MVLLLIFEEIVYLEPELEITRPSSPVHFFLLISTMWRGRCIVYISRKAESGLLMVPQFLFGMHIYVYF